MHLELLQEIPNDPALRGSWNALVAVSDQPQVFYTWEWARAVDLAYHQTLRPWLALARESGGLVGLVALALDSPNRAVFLASSTGDYCDFLSPAERRTEFVDAVFVELRKAGIHELSLANLPADSPTVPALEAAAARHGFAIYARPAYECARVVLGSAEERAQLKIKLGKKKTFRRSMHALAREGPVQVSHLTTWQQVEPVLSEFANAHVARFLATGRISNLARSERRLFLHELARLLCESRNLALSRFTIGDRAIAWNYGFRFHKSWFWYQPTFESSLEVYSPGRLLLANMMMEACDDPAVEIFDLGLGAEGYKERVATGSRQTLHVTLSQSPLNVVREKVRYRLAEKIKRSPRLEASIRQNLGRAESARKRLHDNGPASFASHAGRRVARSIAGHDDIRFYQWEGTSAGEAAPPGSFTLEPINLHLLADAAMVYEGDAETATYLIRSAQRAHSGGSGYALRDHTGAPVHFCWVASFEGFFIAELQTRLSAPSPEATLIYDCWTPAALRNQGLYTIAIAKLAMQLTREGHPAWIFSAATNQSSIRGIERTGFRYRYSMIATKTPLGRKITTHPSTQSPSEF